MTPIQELKYRRGIKRLKAKYPHANYAWIYHDTILGRYGIAIGMTQPTFAEEFGGYYTYNYDKALVYANIIMSLEDFVMFDDKFSREDVKDSLRQI